MHYWLRTDAGYVAAKFVEEKGDRMVVMVGEEGGEVGTRKEVDKSLLLEAGTGPAVPDLTTMVVLNEAT